MNDILKALHATIRLMEKSNSSANDAAMIGLLHMAANRIEELERHVTIEILDKMSLAEQLTGKKVTKIYITRAMTNRLHLEFPIGDGSEVEKIKAAGTLFGVEAVFDADEFRVDIDGEKCEETKKEPV